MLVCLLHIKWQQRKIAKESVIMRRSFQKALLPHKMRKSISAKKIFCLPWSKEDILSSLERAKKRNRAALGTPKVPDVKWEDVGGLEEVQKVILDTIQLPLMYKHLFSSKLRKRSPIRCPALWTSRNREDLIGESSSY